MSNRYLILTRLGRGHRLHGLLGVPRERRNWDLAVSLYDLDLTLPEADAVDYAHRQAGGKWDGIHAFFQAYPELLARYDYFWLVDDDIEASAAQADALFAYVQEQGFEIAQPALTLDSFYSHRLTLQCPGFRHRHTNFVELMLPVLCRRVLQQVLPHCADTQSGLGIDWLWNRYVSRPATAMAIIDAIAMPHRRPLNRHLRGRMRRDGRCPHRERQRLGEGRRLERVYPVAFAGVLEDGRRVTSRVIISLLMTRAYWLARGSMRGRPWRWRDYPIFAWRQTFTDPAGGDPSQRLGGLYD